MLKRIINKAKQLLAGKSNEDLTVEACIAAGMKVGKNVSGVVNCTIDYGSCWLIEIEDDVVFAPEIYLLAHDTSTKKITGYTRVGKIRIEKNAFIGARVLIMPNVVIGANSIVGSCSVVTKDVPPNVVVAGNPAKIICTLEEYAQKVKKSFGDSPQYDTRYTIPGGITDDMKEQMKAAIVKSGYVQ